MLKMRWQTMSDADFRNVYDAFWSKLYSLAYNYFRDKTTAQELVQDVFVNLWLKRDQLGHVDDLKAYLFKSMKNKIYDHFDKLASQEKLKTNSAHLFQEEIHNTEEALDYEETLGLINEEIEKLPATTKTIFRLSRFERYTNDEIATRMHVSGKAVEYHISQALKRLRLHLNNLLTFLIVLFLLR